jgi:hypothetical protein
VAPLHSQRPVIFKRSLPFKKLLRKKNIFEI